MSATRSNRLSQAGLPQCSAGLTTVLCCCLAGTMSFADGSIHETRFSASPPATHMEWGGPRRNDEFLVLNSMPIEGRDACFAINDQISGPFQPREVQERQALLLPMMAFCIGLVAAGDDMGWSGHEANGDHAKTLGHWDEAERAYATAVGFLDRTVDNEVNQDLAALLNKLGAVRFMQNDFAGAEQAIRRALTIYTSTRSAEDLHVADTLDLLGSALFEQQQGRALAGPLFFRAWVIRAGALVPDHPAIAESLHHIAVSLYADNLSLAIPLVLQAKEIREKVFGPDHPMVAMTLSAMARIYEAHNRRDLAIPLYQDALRIQETAFGPSAMEAIRARDHLETASREKPQLR
jgi:hypothetical protein